MNIIHVVLGKANPDRMNGINKVVDNLAKEQTLLGYHVSVWGLTPTPQEETPSRLYELVLFKTSSFRFCLTDEIEMAISQTNSDTIFHIHGGFIIEFYLLVKLLNKYNREYVFTPHGNYAANAIKKNGFFKKIYFSLFEKEILKKSKALHCIGQGEWNDIDKLVKLNNKVLIPNGQNIADVQTSEVDKNSHDEPIFGFCGRVTKDQKGLDLLLEGFDIYIKEYFGKGKLWIIGDGEYLNEMKQYAQMNDLQNEIVFWGVQYGNEKFKLIASMDSFFHTSRNEGLPTAVLEAAALGVPCVVSEFTNMGEYIEAHEAGIYLKSNTPQEIAFSMNEIAKMKKEGELSRLGENASEMIKNRFNWSAIAKDLVEVYQK